MLIKKRKKKIRLLMQAPSLEDSFVRIFWGLLREREIFPLPEMLRIGLDRNKAGGGERHDPPLETRI